MRIELSSFVEPDLDAIAEALALDHPASAVSFLEEIGRAIRAIGDAPQRYSSHPEIGEGVCTAVAGHSVILFRIAKGLAVQMVRIERVLLAAQDLATLGPEPATHA